MQRIDAYLEKLFSFQHKKTEKAKPQGKLPKNPKSENQKEITFNSSYPKNIFIARNTLTPHPALMGRKNTHLRIGHYLKKHYGIHIDKKQNADVTLKSLGVKPARENIHLDDGRIISINGFAIMQRGADGNFAHTSYNLRLTENSRKTIDNLDENDKRQIPNRYLDKNNKAKRYLPTGELDGAIYHSKGSELKAIQSSQKTIYITESSLKAIRLGQIQAQYAHVLGLNGIGSYCKDGQINSEFAEMNLNGRRVVLVPDSDYRDNQAVAISTENLASELSKLGAKVEIALIPNKKDNGETQGIDDFCINQSPKESRDLIDGLEKTLYSEDQIKNINDEELKKEISAFQDYRARKDENGKASIKNSQDHEIEGKEYGQWKNRLRESLLKQGILNPSQFLDPAFNELEKLKNHDLHNLNLGEVIEKLTQVIEIKPSSNTNKNLRKGLILKIATELTQRGENHLAQETLEEKLSTKDFAQNYQQELGNLNLVYCYEKGIDLNEKRGKQIEAYAKIYQARSGLYFSILEKAKLLQDLNQIDNLVEKINPNPQKPRVPNLESRIEGFVDNVIALAGIKGNHSLIKNLIDDLDTFNASKVNHRFNGPLFEATANDKVLQKALNHHIEAIGVKIQAHDGTEIEIDAISYGKLKDENDQRLSGRFHAEYKDSFAAFTRSQDPKLKDSDEILAALIEKYGKQIKTAQRENAHAIVVVNTYNPEGKPLIRTEKAEQDLADFKMAADIIKALPELVILNQNGENLRDFILSQHILTQSQS